MMRLLIILSIVFFLSGCSTNEIPERFIPKNANELANNYLDSLVNGNLNYCYDKLSEGLRNEEAKDFNLQIYEFLKDKNLIAKRIISSNTEILYSENTSKFYNLSYEYQYSDSLWEYFYFKILEKENDLSIVGFNIQPYNQPLGLEHEFIFHEKSLLHYVWFTFAILIPIFILITLIFALKTKLKRKWLWIIFILLGFVTFSLNWTTGESGITPIKFNLLGAGIIKSGIIAPWILSFSIPFGAIIFWFKRRKIFIERRNNDTTTKNIVHLADSAKYEDISNKYN